MLPTGPMEHGYPHLALIRSALRDLVPRIRDGRLPPVPGKPWTGWADIYDMLEPELSVQKLARAIADAYGITVRTILVTFEPNLPVPGLVTLRQGPQVDFVVELKSNLKLLPREITAVLGHEVAHIFLHRHGLRRAETLPDEILTDTAAALYGFGVLTLDAYTVTSHQSGDSVSYTERRLGYLTPEEVGYVLEKGGVSGVVDHLSGGAARAAHAKGARRHRRDLGAPLADCGWWSRGLYRLLRWWTLLSGRAVALTEDRVFGLTRDKVEFRCPVCTQRLRLPVGKVLTARCGRCGHEVACET